jgi:hypothetical protein
MARRRYGAAAARTLAGSASLSEALSTLVATPYGHDVRADHTLAEAQHALGATVLWHLRVLAGWTPRQGSQTLRALAGGFEIANLDEHLRVLRGQPTPPPYRLGTLGTAWVRLARTTTPAEIRDVLAGSPWGDPGQESPWAIAVGMRLSWATRIPRSPPAVARWSAGGAALLVAREHFLAGRRLPEPMRRTAATVLGRDATEAPSFAEFSRLLPRDAAWVLDGVTEPDRLWRAEATWWRGLEDDGFALLRGSRFDAAPLLGAAAVLAADAWRVRAALEIAARGGGPLEVFDAVA